MKGVIVHTNNPFTEVLELKTKKKHIKIAQGKDLFNRETGELEDVSHIVSFKEVDDEEFIKIYSANIHIMFGLESAGHKVFQILLRAVQTTAINRDQLYFNEQVALEIAEIHGLKLSKSTYLRGVKDLIKNQILAQSNKPSIFFINTAVLFNGDRYAFTQAIKRKEKPKDISASEAAEKAIDGFKLKQERDGEVG
jgi:hypothetical protein